jgi:hypothetical protein
VVPTLQPPGISGIKLVTPQANRFVTYGNPSFSQQIFNISMASIEPMTEPDGVLDNLERKSMAFVRIIYCFHAIIVTQQ